MRHRESPPRGRLIQSTSGDESKLIQVLTSPRHMRKGRDASQTRKQRFVYKRALHPSQAKATNCIRSNWLERLSSPTSGLFGIVKCDETDYRVHLLRNDRSRSGSRRVSALGWRSKFPRKIFIRLGRNDRRKSLRKVEPANDVDLNPPVFIKLIKKCLFRGAPPAIRSYCQSTSAKLNFSVKLLSPYDAKSELRFLLHFYSSIMKAFINAKSIHIFNTFYPYV